MHDRYSFYLIAKAKRSCAQKYHLIERFPFALFHQCAKGCGTPLATRKWANYFRQPWWIAGMSCFLVGQAANIPAMAFAPQTMLSCLGGLALVTLARKGDTTWVIWELDEYVPFGYQTWLAGSFHISR